MSGNYSAKFDPKVFSISPLAWPLIALIRVYRYTLSPIIGQSCRFEPTCSQYAEEALRHYGAFRGSIKAAKRIVKCHPFHPGGYDPVQ